MIDREKIIKGLTECVAAGLENACPADCPYFLQCFPDTGLATPFGLVTPFMSLMADALSLLKEQEAVEPVLMREGRNEYYNDYVCPECDNELVFGQNFCSECGRQVKWDGRT